MKKVFGLVIVFTLLLSSSCNKGSNDMVYIRFENISQKAIDNAALNYYWSGQKYIETQMRLGTIQPGEITSYIGFERLSCNSSTPLVGLKGNIDGQPLEYVGAWCGVGTTTMKNGHYTAEIIVENNNAYIQLKQ